jgi:glycosyltransferase involved in cell wall biosynthesis
VAPAGKPRSRHDIGVSVSFRIAVTVDPYIPVPPRLYGGIERVADLAVRGLVARGHHVTLFAHPDSRVGVPLVPYGAPPHVGRWNRMKELWQLGSALVRRRRDFDVVFSWGRLAALTPILLDRRLPKIQRYCRNVVPWRGVRTAVTLAGHSICFAGASASVYSELNRYGPSGGRWFTLYDAIDVSLYELVPQAASDAPLVFLGRLERIKGAHTAIAIAKRAGRRLILAGNHAMAGPEAAYFQQEIAPALDGEQISYVGPVDDEAKNRLLGSAAALLFPIEWKEAFGIVMAEAMACGTPVIGFPCGSVPEIIINGRNGFICSNVEEAAVATTKLLTIDRADVRADCEARFSQRVLVDRLLSIISLAAAAA